MGLLIDDNRVSKASAAAHGAVAVGTRANARKLSGRTGGVNPVRVIAPMRAIAPARVLAPVQVLGLMAVLAAAVGPSGANAQTIPSPTDVPSPADVLGYDVGERFTDTAGIERYFRALDQASDLVTVDSYGETPEGRPLLQALIATPSNRSRLEEILALNAELTDPETTEARSREIAGMIPAVVYLTYGIHGNESSSSEAAMWTAFDLVGDPELEAVLDSLVIVMDPAANPDGRDRYVQFYRQTASVRPNANPGTWDRSEPWPGGRFNHYLLDLNRDWAWLSQPESRARVARYLRFNPQVHVDFHEMGYTSSYFFFPAGDPINPIYPEHVLEWGTRFGDANARAMDREGLLYFTGQSFDLFYPGYGDSWPSLLGAVGMTYEQGGGPEGGRLIERPDGSVLTLADRAHGHRVTGRATLRAAADGKTELLQGFAAFHRDVDEGIEDTFLVPGADPTQLASLVELLSAQGIQVEQTDEEVRAETVPHPGFEGRDELPPGTARVRARQPRGRLASALLRPDNLLEGTSSYDITAWSLPYAFGVEAHSSAGNAGGTWHPFEPVADPAGPVANGSYGYLLPPSFSHMGRLGRFLELEGRALAVADTFSVGDIDYPRGTLFFPRGRNPDLDELLAEADLDGVVVPLASGQTTSGPDLGTDSAAPLSLPAVALLGGEGTTPTGFGAHWYFLEQVLDLPFDVLNVADAASADLGSFDVIIVPPGEPLDALGQTGVDRLASWVDAGGTLIAVDAAAHELAGPIAEVTVREQPSDEEEAEDAALARALRTREERELDEWEEQTPGAILSVALDPEHPLAFGAAAAGMVDRAFVLSSGVAFEPSEDFESVAFFPEEVERVSGVISERSLERLGLSAWLVEKRIGSGRVILFADDPLFRLFWHGGYPLLANAILIAPSF